MAGEWIESSLFDFVTLQRGFDLPSANRKGGNIPVVASTSINGWHNEAKVTAPGVVIGRSGSIGGGQYITQDFWPLNTTLWVKSFNGHDPKFVYYLLLSIDFQKYNAGSGVPTLNRNHLKAEKISYPPLAEQKRIAHLLGSLDDKIELNRKMNETLEEMAQAIFKSWFIDFDGVDEADLVESELGLIPRGWEVGTIGTYANIKSGKRQTDRTDTKSETHHIPLLGGAGQIGWTSKPLFSNAIITTGRVGTLGVVKRWHTPVWASDNVLVLTPKSAEHFQLLYYTLGLINYQNLNSGSTQPLLTQSALKPQKMIIPERLRVIEFENLVATLQNKILLNEQQTQTLSELRDTLLPKLISGELRIPEAEEQVAQQLQLFPEQGEQ